MRHRLARTMLAAALVAGMSFASATTATAKIVERDRWAFIDAFSDEYCGIEVDFDVAASGRVMVRADRPGSTAFLATNQFEWREVITNPENGKSLTQRGKVNYREVKATPVGDGVYLFRAHSPGQPFVIENQAGKVVYRESGLLIFEILYDTFGDDQPGGEELSFEMVGMRGYPGALDDVCGVVHDLIG